MTCKNLTSATTTPPSDGSGQAWVVGQNDI